MVHNAEWDGCSWHWTRSIGEHQKRLCSSLDIIWLMIMMTYHTVKQSNWEHRTAQQQTGWTQGRLIARSLNPFCWPICSASSRWKDLLATFFVQSGRWSLVNLKMPPSEECATVHPKESSDQYASSQSWRFNAENVLKFFIPCSFPLLLFCFYLCNGHNWIELPTVPATSWASLLLLHFFVCLSCPMQSDRQMLQVYI